LKHSIIDQINERSSHKAVATRSGGISIFLTLLIISSYFYINKIEIFDYSVFIPLSILLVVGLYDDINQVDFKLKFIFQIITAKILIDNGFVIDNMHGIFGINELNRIIAQLFTIFIIVAIINAINFIDGIDGLAVSIVAVFILLFEFFSVGISENFLLSLVLVSSFIPFLYFNLRSKNKIFLGDAGSNLLGGVVSIYILQILSSEYLIKPEYDINKVFYVISILPYPIIDIIRVFVIRLKRKQSPFIADKNHIHHFLLSKLKGHILTSLFIIFLSLILTVIIQLAL
tara:strand:- start:291 stop:1151 length:861 start_codon:yes stop_codon:yes gene_type:complete